MNNHPPPKAFGPTINRISDVMAHTMQFSFWGVGRLAEQAGVSRSTVSRIINGKINPSFVLVARLTAALEAELGRRIDPRDLVAENGAFLTPYTCDLVGCSGCLPERAYDEFGDLKPAYQSVTKGQWVTSRFPKGFQKGEK